MEVNHLAAMLNLINVVSQRGAFRGEELTNVGELYNIINEELTKQKEQTESKEPEVEVVSGEVLS